MFKRENTLFVDRKVTGHTTLETFVGSDTIKNSIQNQLDTK